MKKTLIALTIFLLTTAAFADKDRSQEHGYLGVSIQAISNPGVGRADNGVYIAGVNQGSGAEAAGLKEKDRIASINGQAIETMEDLEVTMDATRPGDEVTVMVLRGESESSFNVVLGEAPSSGNLSFGEGKYLLELLEPTPHLGAELQTLSPQLAEFFDVDRGVLVTSVSEGGAAADAGLRAGDIITEVGEATIRDTSDVTDALLGLGQGDTAELTIRNRGRVEVLPVTFGDSTVTAMPFSFDVKLDTGTVTVERDSLSRSGNLSIELAPVVEEKALQTQIEELEERLLILRQRLEQEQRAN